MNLVSLLLFFVLRCFKSKAVAVDFDEACKDIIDTASVWGTGVLKYRLKCPDEMRGISTFGDGSDSCYTDVLPLCSIKFDPYNSMPGCQSTVETFVKVVEACSVLTSMAQNGLNCTGFDIEHKIVSDPRQFCQSAKYSIDGPEDEQTGLPQSFSLKGFANGESQDCELISKSYNSCLNVGVKKFGFDIKTCLDVNFKPYCNSIVSTVENLAVCASAILPYLIEKLPSLNTFNNPDLCNDVYRKHIVFLAKQNGELIKKSIAAKSILNSANRITDYINQFKSKIIRSIAYDTEVNNALLSIGESFEFHKNATHVYGIKYPQSLVSDYSSLAKQVKDTSDYILRLASTTFSGVANTQEGPAKFNEMRKILDAIEAIESPMVQKMKLFDTSVKSFVTQSVSAMYALPHTSAIERSTEDLINRESKTMRQSLNTMRNLFDDSLNKWVEPQFLDIVHKAVEDGKRYRKLSLSFDTQIKSISKLNK